MANHPHEPTPGHPIPVEVARSIEGFATLADVPAWSLSDDEAVQAAVALSRHEAQVAELKARVLAQVDADRLDATSLGAWLAVTTQTTRPAAFRQARLATALGHHEQVREAMTTGHVNAEQAPVICEAVDALPEQPGLREQCTKHLVALAEHHDAKALRVLGRRVLEVVDPDAADAHEGELLEREEREAAKATSFSMWETGDGRVKGKFTLPALDGAMLRKALMAIAAPKHQRATGETYDHERPTHHRLGQAFAEYVSRYPLDRLPKAGGLNATVIVTLDLDTLLGGLRAASLDTGGRITAGTARRLACEAGIIPAVLDGRSRVLDLGRKMRFHDDAQRLALALTQKHCQRPGCDVPAWLCHVHHKKPWALGGRTNLKDAELLCPRHHTVAHRDPPTPPLRT